MGSHLLVETVRNPECPKVSIKRLTHSSCLFLSEADHWAFTQSCLPLFYTESFHFCLSLTYHCMTSGRKRRQAILDSVDQKVYIISYVSKLSWASGSRHDSKLICQNIVPDIMLLSLNLIVQTEFEFARDSNVDCYNNQFLLGYKMLPHSGW